MTIKSLHGRLIFGVALATTVVLVCAALSLYGLLHSSLISDFDATLGAEAHALQSMVEFDGGGFKIDLDAWNADNRRLGRHVYFELNDATGRHLAQSKSEFPNLILTSTGRADHGEWVALPDGSRGRVMHATFSPHAEEDEPGASKPPAMTIVIAKDASTLDRTLLRAAITLTSVWLASLAILLTLTGWIVRRAIRPVVHLAAEIENVREADPRQRVSENGLPSELAPVASRLNALLARLAAAFERERGFTADAAHELRTPLAALETTIEVCNAQPRTPAAYQKVLNDCLAVVRTMRSMVSGLLVLARGDAQALALDITDVNVDELLDECLASTADATSSRHVAISQRIERPLSIRSDRDKVRQILANVFENAARYVDAEGTIAISAVAVDKDVVVRIVNSGSTIPVDETDRVFDRFWRGDTSRTIDGAGSGLGLSVCKKLIDSLGGTIQITSTEGGDFVVTLTLPKRSDGSHAGPPPLTSPAAQSPAHEMSLP